MLEIDYGLKDMAGWKLREARGVDIFGQNIVGWGTHNGVEEAWLARLPDPCPADLNHDGMVGMQDMLLMFALVGSCEDCMNCPGDLNADCLINSTDILALFAVWGPGP